MYSWKLFQRWLFCLSTTLWVKNISRRLHPITPSYATGVKNTDIVPLVKQISENIKEGKTLQEKFTKLAKNEANCSFTHFFKAKYVSSIFGDVLWKQALPWISVSGTTWRRLRWKGCHSIFCFQNSSLARSHSWRGKIFQSTNLRWWISWPW